MAFGIATGGSSLVGGFGTTQGPVGAGAGVDNLLLEDGSNLLLEDSGVLKLE